MSLTDVADELYGLNPSEFTAARNAAARLDAAPKAEIMALKKPTPAAWVVNLLVRERRDQLDAVLELGSQLREAQSDLDRDALAQLGQQRRQLVKALAKQGGEIAELRGQRVSPAVADEVAHTLQAAMADADAATAVRTGRLLRSLETLGLSVDLDGAVAVPGKAARVTPPVIDELEEKRAAARRRAADTQREIERAETAHEQAERRVADARRRRDAAEENLSEAQDRVKLLRGALADSERELTAVTAERDAAAASAEKARNSTG